jgi:hypothetical protein
MPLITAIRLTILAFRATVAVGQTIRNIPERVRSSKAAWEKERAEKIQREADLVSARESLYQLIEVRGLNITAVELGNAIGYYLIKGESDVEAHLKYRRLLEGGKRYPASKAALIRAGVFLRGSLDMLTAEDQNFIKDRELIFASRKMTIHSILCLLALGFAAYFSVEGNFGTALFSLVCAFVFGLVAFANFGHQLSLRRS